MPASGPPPRVGALGSQPGAPSELPAAGMRVPGGPLGSGTGRRQRALREPPGNSGVERDGSVGTQAEGWRWAWQRERGGGAGPAGGGAGRGAGPAGAGSGPRGGSGAGPSEGRGLRGAGSGASRRERRRGAGPEAALRRPQQGAWPRQIGAWAGMPNDITAWLGRLLNSASGLEGVGRDKEGNRFVSI